MGIENGYHANIENVAEGEIDTAVFKDIINKEKTGKFKTVERLGDVGLTEMPKVDFKTSGVANGKIEHKTFSLVSESIFVDSKSENTPSRIYLLTSNEGNYPPGKEYQKAKVYRIFFIDPGSNSFDQQANFVGYIKLNFSDGSELAELKMVEVVPGFSRRGFGELLKEKAAEFFESIGVNKIHVEVINHEDSMGAAAHNYRKTPPAQ